MIKFIKRVILVFLILCILCIGAYGYMGHREYEQLVSETSIESKIEDLKNSNHYVKLEDVSKDYLNAVIAIEDHRFYTHGGVDFITLIRNIIVNVKSKKVKGGGSTITQQLAKNFYLMNSTSLFKKASELFISQDLESFYEKDEILELYINIIYFGDGYYGIYDASMGYFGRDPSRLTLGEASMLAGLPQSPSYYALSNHNDASYVRQEEVLQAMLKYKYIEEDDYLAAKNEFIYE